ncbi:MULTISPECIES: PTS lactose/cellobiose transporter subunit IIA [Thermoanaerobacterium]|uniref:Phosphotransferase system PTS lactose/cellobiose-specific IIA subunit n=2 Tax=Thermoanaerobacterium TaxID=28895 RepID=W9EBS4_9THEO|nr:MULTISPECIES: PTS lactose/cellobiose transporter subunit IIA [Thermoanaerobacterium]AFK85147.1 phosphotransferase system PTS lactose/cellobiose-specific IIA subunit [Thermoanaerobacterium saccharolyticum JW/SL-YS485]ETO39517.1 phosphotransferase system PTS lactose/cellobiose-specific IIA subunit [Thermoanaerobacterium aotearoense SCUT27]
MELEEIVFQIILNAGNAKSNCFDALKSAKEGDFKSAENYISKAEEEIIKAHNIQTSMLQKEANGDHQIVTLLLMHAEDHMMSAILAKDLITEMIDLYKLIYSGKGVK